LAPGRSSRRGSLVDAYAALDERSSDLFARLWSGLSGIDGVTVYGPPPTAARTATIAFTVDGMPSSEVARQLGERAVFVSHGNFYAATVVERLGLGAEGLVRAGCAIYTTADEVDRLIEGVHTLG
jgi:selenocysteine lyase/cysteine desulfurase